MRTAVDSSVLIAIVAGEPSGRAWMDCLVRARKQGPLLICETVFAECSCGFDSVASMAQVLHSLGIQFDPIREEAAFLAGKTFLAYRRAGGPRTTVLPDFLIAAHAQCQADRLAAADRGYLRTYFKTLKLLSPI